MSDSLQQLFHNACLGGGNTTTTARDASSSVTVESIREAMQEIEDRFGGMPQAIVAPVQMRLAMLPFTHADISGTNRYSGMPAQFYRDEAERNEIVAYLKSRGMKRLAVFDDRGKRIAPVSWTFEFESEARDA